MRDGEEAEEDANDETSSLRAIVEGGGLLDEWRLFVQSLVQNLENQASFPGEVPKKPSPPYKCFLKLRRLTGDIV